MKKLERNKIPKFVIREIPITPPLSDEELIRAYHEVVDISKKIIPNDIPFEIDDDFLIEEPPLKDLPEISYGAAEVSDTEIVKDYAFRRRFLHEPEDPHSQELALRYTLMVQGAKALIEEIEGYARLGWYGGDDAFYDYIPGAVDLIKAAGDYVPDDFSNA